MVFNLAALTAFAGTHFWKSCAGESSPCQPLLGTAVDIGVPAVLNHQGASSLFKQAKATYFVFGLPGGTRGVFIAVI